MALPPASTPVRLPIPEDLEDELPEVAHAGNSLRRCSYMIKLGHQSGLTHTQGAHRNIQALLPSAPLIFGRDSGGLAVLSRGRNPEAIKRRCCSSLESPPAIDTTGSSASEYILARNPPSLPTQAQCPLQEPSDAALPSLPPSTPRSFPRLNPFVARLSHRLPGTW